jgi:branched-chain amino acid transport system ATP-binding protein
MLEARDLATSYGSSQVLFGVDLEVGEGEVVALLGRNGMGKTTTVRSVMGLTPPWRGSVRFRGRDITGLPAHRVARLGVGLVPEGRQIFPNLTVHENLVATARRGAGRAGAWTVERVYGMFPALAERAGHAGNHLSGGEQQMLAVGRALMSRPKLLLLDEPSMGLAPTIADAIFDRIQEIHREDRVSILLVEQRVAEALESCDRGYVLETGRVVLEGPHDALLADERVRAAYLGM